MSSFPDGRRPGKGLDKSNFTQTCNLLSQFLKHKRTSASLPFTATKATEEDTTATAATMDLLTNLNLQNSDDASRQYTFAMDLIPQFVENPCIKQSGLRSPFPESESESETPLPQLTLFYGAKVLVFDAFPPDKATEVMELATELGSDHFGNQTNPPGPTTPPLPLPLPLRLATRNSNIAHHLPRSGPQAQAFGSDMRYPRRASLLKFLEKRKERVIAKGPYHTNNPKHEGSSSGGDHPEHHRSSKQFDLNL